MPGYSCAFRGCHSKTGAGLALFSFPKDEDRAKLWLEACCRTDLLSKTAEELSSNYKLCEHHFEDKYYNVGASRKRLLPNALPTLFPDPTKRTCEKKELEEAPPKKVSKNIKILSDVAVVPASTKQETLSEQALIAGSAEQSLLDISGKPPPEITWLINDQAVENTSNIGVSSTTLVPNNSRVVRSDLRIMNLGRKDVHSEITCQATNNEKTPPHAATLHVDMNFGPLDVKLLGPNQPLSAGRRYELLCQSTGSRPPATITWWKNGQRLERTKDLVFVTSQKPYSMSADGV